MQIYARCSSDNRMTLTLNLRLVHAERLPSLVLIAQVIFPLEHGHRQCHRCHYHSTPPLGYGWHEL